MLEMPFNDLLFKAHRIHRANFAANQVQVSALLSIKTGACPEDCKYCPQSSHNQAPIEREALLPIASVVAAAKRAKDKGSTRFCMGAAWRKPNNKQLDAVIERILAVREQGMETCVTLGMLSAEQAQRLKAAGLDYYNHNLDTSPEFYGQIITTRTYRDRLKTLASIRAAGLKTCCGGIIGMGEKKSDRAGLLMQLANLPQHPDSVPINQLVRVKGTPLANVEAVDSIDFIRTVAAARVMMPKSWLRLSAGRAQMSEEAQAMCFFAGANSIFYGDKLLTTDNAKENHDLLLLDKLGISTIKQKTQATDSEHLNLLTPADGHTSEGHGNCQSRLA